jgi:D-aminoacyl-tRNA deacylase
MRVLIQRVSKAAVHVSGRQVGAIEKGLLLLVGITHSDTSEILEAMAAKIVNMRIFPSLETDSHFDRSVIDENGGLLAVSQFTLYADCRKGRRPSFTDAAEPALASRLFDQFVGLLRAYPLRVETGEFGALMDVSLVNDGPVSIWIDSDRDLTRKR